MGETGNAVVTGASAGIGLAVSRRLLEAGYAVTGIARDFSKCGIHHPRFTPREMDLAELDQLPGELERLQAHDKEIHALVCCAGRGRFGSLEEFSHAQIRALVDLNFTSQAMLVRALLPGMKRRGRGDIILMGSEAALSGGRRGAVYSASKFALRGLAQALRQECAKSGVRVSLINPGMVRTDFFEPLDFRPGDDPANYLLPDDVAGAVLTVLSARPETVFDEINLSPLKTVIRFKDRPPKTE